ncbi:hypothetical protein AYX15_01812 [Cryptococcus neoformans]|nr:hypothetical protein AYX15_01812 [Cryptococcus neoformans var. grubii]
MIIAILANQAIIYGRQVILQPDEDRCLRSPPCTTICSHKDISDTSLLQPERSKPFLSPSDHRSYHKVTDRQIPDPFHKMNEEVFTAVPHADTGLSSPTEHQTSQPELACLTRSGSYVYPVCSRKSQLSATKVSVHDGTYQDGGDIARFITPGGNPIDTSQPGFPVFHRKFGNPTSVGLISFTGAALLLNLYGIQARGVTKPNIILGVAFGLGGLGQIIAGILAWACGNTFGSVTFSSYGAFWLSFSTLYIPQFDVAAAYAKNPAMFENALGLYLCVWGIVTVLFLIASHRSSVILICIFGVLSVDLFVLSAGYLLESPKCIKAGGAIGIITAILGAYTSLAELVTADTGFFRVPVGNLAPKDD